MAKVFSSSGVQKVTGVASGKDAGYFKQVGNSPNERWYLCGASGAGGALTTGAPAIDTLHAIPFFSRRAGTIDQVAINVTTLAAGGLAKVMIFTNTSDTVIYPYTMVSVGAEVSVATTGVKTFQLDYSVAENSLYWMVYWVGVAAPTIRCPVIGNMDGRLIGTDNTLGVSYGVGFQVGLTYNSITNPSTYPVSATILSAAPIAGIFNHYSA